MNEWIVGRAPEKYEGSWPVFEVTIQDGARRRSIRAERRETNDGGWYRVDSYALSFPVLAWRSIGEPYSGPAP